jgi:hypothetical protein
MESFDSTKISIDKILDDVHVGKIQLPDFFKEDGFGMMTESKV